jgi:hypothetical protein
MLSLVPHESSLTVVHQFTGAYEEQPFGMCSQLFKTGKKPKNMTDFLRRGWRGPNPCFLHFCALLRCCVVCV